MARMLAFGCTHLPVHSEAFRQWRLEKIREYKPDVVINLGDWVDADGASRWENENDWTLQTEYTWMERDANETLQAMPENSTLVWLKGNHCANLDEPGRISPKLRAASSWVNNIRTHWIADHPRIKIIEYGHDKYYRLGQVTFQHGCQTNINAERDQALLYGVPFGLHVSAHTHRPMPVTRVVLPGKVPVFGIHIANVGCGADWEKMRYVRRSNHALWGRAILVGECNSKQHRAWFGSKQWDAELIVHSRALDR